MALSLFPSKVVVESHSTIFFQTKLQPKLLLLIDNTYFQEQQNYCRPRLQDVPPSAAILALEVTKQDKTTRRFLKR